MLALLSSTQQCIDLLAKAPQVPGAGDLGSGGGGLRAWCSNVAVGPSDRDMGATAVRKHQYEIELILTSDLAEDFQLHAIEGVVPARYPDLLWQVVEAGSVSGGPSTRSIMNA